MDKFKSFLRTQRNILRPARFILLLFLVWNTNGFFEGYNLRAILREKAKEMRENSFVPEKIDKTDQAIVSPNGEEKLERQSSIQSIFKIALFFMDAFTMYIVVIAPLIDWLVLDLSERSNKGMI